MNRNKKGVMPEITREVYKNVKKFDRQQFTGFCTDLYKYGYEDGRESVPGVELEESAGCGQGTGQQEAGGDIVDELRSGSGANDAAYLKGST